MTTTRWTTTADVPAAPWAAMGADMRKLLATTAAGGAAVTGPTGVGGPIINESTIAFTVTAPGSPPLTVNFSRTAGTGSATTHAAHTDGLVLTAMRRARRHFGTLLVIDTDADTTSRAAGEALVDGLYAVDDQALTAAPGMSAASHVAQIVSRALGRVNPSRGGVELTVAEHFDAVLAELQAERAGIAAAQALLTPPPPPAPAPAPAPAP